MKFATSIDSLFHEDFSVACGAVWQHFIHSRTSFKIGDSDPAAAFSTKVIYKQT